MQNVMSTLPCVIHASMLVICLSCRFKGSTLQVMGTVVEKGEWAIVGGTGEFTLARGIIYKPRAEYINQVGDVIQLDIHCFYTPVERSKVTKIFPYTRKLVHTQSTNFLHSSS